MQATARYYLNYRWIVSIKKRLPKQPSFEHF